MQLPAGFVSSERALSHLTRDRVDLLLSPYPNLPVFGIGCPSLNTVHDVLYLTHPSYSKRFKSIVDSLRLRKSLTQALLTWYVSSTSLEETRKHFGIVGNSARVRYPAIDEKFGAKPVRNEQAILASYQLKAGYILSIGNGLPHKNLGILLEIVGDLSRQLVFVGVPQNNRDYWQKRYRNAPCQWIAHVHDHDLPTIIRAAFCLAHPSTAEGFCYPPLEAMACGIPCVTSNIPVLAETTGGNALTASLADRNAWVHAFDALENNDLYTSQVKKGLRWVESLRGPQGWHKHISDLEELLFK
jgi:glycosyltransferase involved in cell wall biosynthesis